MTFTLHLILIAEIKTMMKLVKATDMEFGVKIENMACFGISSAETSDSPTNTSININYYVSNFHK